MILVLYKIFSAQFLYFALIFQLYKIIAQLAIYKYTSFKIAIYIIQSNLYCILKNLKNLKN